MELQFKEGMSWNNYGQDGWVMDHIICHEETIVNVGYRLGTAREKTARSRALCLLIDG